MNAKFRSLVSALFGLALAASLGACAMSPDEHATYDSHDSLADIYHGGDSDR